MEQEALARLPELKLFSIPPEQVQRLAPLLTEEARELIARREAFSICAVEQGEVCAAICGLVSGGNTDSLEVVSLYVAPSHRRRLVGTTLLLELIDEAADIMGGELRRVELTFPDSAEGLHELLQTLSFSFEPVENAGTWSVPVIDLASCPLMQTKGRVQGTLVSFAELTSYQLRQLFLSLERFSADYITFDELERAAFKLSFAVYGEQERLEACVILEEQENARYCLKQFFCSRSHLNAAAAVLRASAEALLTSSPENAMLEIPTVVDSASQLAGKLLGRADERKNLTRAVLLLE